MGDDDVEDLREASRRASIVHGVDRGGAAGHTGGHEAEQPVHQSLSMIQINDNASEPYRMYLPPF